MSRLADQEKTPVEREGDWFARPPQNVILSFISLALFALTEVIYSSTGNDKYAVILYLAVLVIAFSILQYRAFKANKRRLEAQHRLAEAQTREDRNIRLSFEHTTEVISSAQSEILNELRESNDRDSIKRFVTRLLEDLTTRVFEADPRGKDVVEEKWTEQSFLTTVMVREHFRQEDFAEVQERLNKNSIFQIPEKDSDLKLYNQQVSKDCMMIRFWFYPGHGHPDSLGIPYVFNKGVAGNAWASKSTIVWTKELSCTPRFEIRENLLDGKYKGGQEKYESMVCVPIESHVNERKMLPPSNEKDDGVLGILTVSSRRKNYFLPERSFAQYVQTLLGPYLVILSYAIERLKLLEGLAVQTGGKAAGSTGTEPVPKANEPVPNVVPKSSSS
jgi:hypothetical protein